MKKFTKLLTVLALSLTLCLSIVACGSETTLEGTWVMDYIEVDGEKFSGDDALAAMQVTDFSYEFKADGVLIGTVNGAASEGTYSQNGNTITVTAGGLSSDFTLDGNSLKTETPTGTMAMVKK